MATRALSHSIEELARRGDELYEREIRPRVEKGNEGKIVAIDVDTGDFGIGEDELSASDPLVARHPDAQIWFVRVGSAAVHRFLRHGGPPSMASTLQKPSVVPARLTPP
jgi:hypothetical protein